MKESKSMFHWKLQSVSCFWLMLTCHLYADIGSAEFERLHKLLQPKPDEAWRTIPWKISLLEAQKAAVHHNKPIFIWAMDGHPLGCT